MSMQEKIFKIGFFIVAASICLAVGFIFVQMCMVTPWFLVALLPLSGIGLMAFSTFLP